MTPPDERPGLPPEQDAVRRLLAEARHDEPVPASVAARLDAALEELTAERRESRDATPVVDLTAARRRRRAGAALLAAAAVVVGGIAVGNVVTGVGGDSSGSDAASTADRDDAGSTESEAEAGAGALEPNASARRAPGAYPAAYRLSSDSLLHDLVAAREAEATAALAGESPQEPEEDSAADDTACDAASLPDPGTGTVVPVTLDGQPALALYRQPSAERQRVAVFLCGESTPERTVTLPSP
jgi:hypothetical protein